MGDDELKSGVKGQKPSEAELAAQIAETQSALGDKLESLTRELRSEVDDTKQAIGRVVERVDAVKASLDVPAHFRRAPFKTFGISVAVGALLGLLGSRSGRRESRTSPLSQARHAKSPLAEVQVATGPLALAGLAFGLLRPALMAATREFVSRKVGQHLLGDVGQSAARGGTAPIGGNGGRADGPVYHSY